MSRTRGDEREEKMKNKELWRAMRRKKQDTEEKIVVSALCRS